jgi:hypothetical protein
MGDEAKRSTQGSAAPGWIYAAGGWTSRGGDDGREGEKPGEGSHTDAVARWNTLFGWGGGRGERERSVGGVQTGGRGWAAARAMPGRGRESAGGEHAKSGGQQRVERRGRAGYLII